jgi:ketosteroid isomerase-like protein
MKTILFKTLFAITALCAGAKAQVKNEKSEDEVKIRTALENWVINFNGGNYEQTFEIWSPELIGWYPGGREVTFADATKIPSGNATTKFELQINEILVDGKLAVVRDTWRQSVKRNAATPEENSTLKSYEIWKKHDDGKWRIIRWISFEEPVKR